MVFERKDASFCQKAVEGSIVGEVVDERHADLLLGIVAEELYQGTKGLFPVRAEFHIGIGTKKVVKKRNRFIMMWC